jgi:hypothetical protein
LLWKSESLDEAEILEVAGLPPLASRTRANGRAPSAIV